MKDLSSRIKQILEDLNREVYEKEKVIGLTLLSALAGESVFLLGPPGVAKSLIARRLKYAFKDARSFEYLMGKFSTPDEVFGPVSIKKLKDEDKYERLTDKYLPGSNIVFLDEIWKASPPIQNSLLTVLNEKMFRNGEQEFKVDIRGLISASNELPLQGEGLEALWDRFLIRLEVGSIEEERHFNEMINLPRKGTYRDPVEPELKITDHEYNSWSGEIDAINLPPHIFGLLNHLRRTVRERNLTADADQVLYVSDRRWRKMAVLLKTSAFFNGRKEVDLMDCFLIADCIWDKHEQIEEAEALVLGAIASYGYRRLIQLTPIREELNTLRQEIQSETQLVSHVDKEQVKLFFDDQEIPFIQLQDFFGKDAPAYMREGDWRKLQADSQGYVPVFEPAGTNYRPFQTYQVRRKDDFTALEKGRELKMTTETIQEEVVSPRLPNPQTLKIWDSQIAMMMQMCEEGLQKIEKRRTLDEPHLRKNLFVSADFADHVMDSLESTTHELLNLKLEIQKTQHSYEAIEAGG